MSALKVKRSAEEYRALCILLVVALLILGLFFYTTENKRIKEIESLKNTINELEETIHEMNLEGYK